MVASGWLEDGVQLLCLIGKGAEACRHLQEQSRWTDAAWLAKVVLPDHEAAAILRRWVDHLVASGRKAKVCSSPDVHFASVGNTKPNIARLLR